MKMRMWEFMLLISFKIVVGHKIIELKTNHLSKGLVPLKRLFDHIDVSKKYVIQT
jgi:hypothetical protein